ncbi:hypothetical protein DAPPUDRAFT_330579 [Daphnia pulex]|uniref:Vps53 N-terminal domain-containing protein n=1 Tax=Daphnia pulex TaxID=6669 RepID=E9HK03_DAPPU|nr:hypothetical protein DAPPUDRAFT_330579 [Daphnia pulex]|eukprot:EFX67908.1 hypothetical protein DAPPUDRAFT_330579 [Daphnia pulex]
MAKRVNEIDVKLLLFTLQKTTQFEELLSRRFTGASMEELLSSEKSAKKIESTNPFEEPVGMNPFEEEDEIEKSVPTNQVQLTITEGLTVSPFYGLISRCFENHLNIFVDSQDKNLAELMDRFVADLTSDPPLKEAVFGVFDLAEIVAGGSKNKRIDGFCNYKSKELIIKKLRYHNPYTGQILDNPSN